MFTGFKQASPLRFQRAHKPCSAIIEPNYFGRDAVVAASRVFLDAGAVLVKAE
jgi:hypothetical protein